MTAYQFCPNGHWNLVSAEVYECLLAFYESDRLREIILV